MLLRHTQDAAAEFAANRSMTGDHFTAATVFGERGLVVGSDEFDFARDSSADREFFSPEEMLTGRPMAEEINPEYQLALNLVLHRDPEERHDRREISNARRYLIANMYASLKESLMADDTVRLFMVGTRDEELIDRDARHIEGTDEPESAASAVADISLSGLTIVVSTLKNLPIDNMTGERRLPIAALKVSHAFDLRLGSNLGDWDTGDPDFGTIDTNDNAFGKPRRQLVRYREKQARDDRLQTERFEAAGIYIGRVVFDKQKYPGTYADFDAADVSLAAAIGALNN